MTTLTDHEAFQKKEQAAKAPKRIKYLTPYGIGADGNLPSRFETFETSKRCIKADSACTSAQRIWGETDRSYGGVQAEHAQFLMPVSRLFRAAPVSRLFRATPVSRLFRATPVSRLFRATPVSRLFRATPVRHIWRNLLSSIVSLVNALPSA